MFVKRTIVIGLLYTGLLGYPVLFDSHETNAAGSYNVKNEGRASWRGSRFQGQETASGETFDMNDLTAAHATLPFGTLVKITSDRTGESVVVRVNDRIEVDSGRIIDVSRRAAKQIGLIEEGIVEVQLEVLSNRTTGRDLADSMNRTNSNSATDADDQSSYQIQYGSFSDFDNASQLQDKLQEQGINAKIDPIKQDDRVYYRVHSGKTYDSVQEAKCVLLFSSPDTAKQMGVVTPSRNDGQASNDGSSSSSDDDFFTDDPLRTSNNNNSSSRQNASSDENYEYGAQFGAFSGISYAKQLQDQLLRKKGLKTIIYQFPDDDRGLYRVLSDRPFESKAAAQRYLNTHNVSGIVLTFVE